MRDSAGRIVTAAGAVLLLANLLFIGLYSLVQLFFSSCLLVGTILLVVGVIAHFELLTPPIRFRGRVAVILLSLTLMLLSMAVISVVYGAKLVGLDYSLGAGQMSSMIINVGFFPEIPPHFVGAIVRPNAWLFVPLTVIAACLLAAGLLIRFAED